MQGLDRVSGVSWSLCATVSKGLEALGGCARRGKRTRSADPGISMLIGSGVRSRGSLIESEVSGSVRRTSSSIREGVCFSVSESILV